MKRKYIRIDKVNCGYYSFNELYSILSYLKKYFKYKYSTIDADDIESLYGETLLTSYKKYNVIYQSWFRIYFKDLLNLKCYEFYKRKLDKAKHTELKEYQLSDENKYIHDATNRVLISQLRNSMNENYFETLVAIYIRGISITRLAEIKGVNRRTIERWRNIGLEKARRVLV